MIFLSLVSSHEEAVALVNQAMSVLGGKERLAQIRSISSTIASHDFLVEQSERPTGPFLHVYSRGNIVLDFDQQSLSGTLTAAGLVYGEQEAKRTLKFESGVAKGLTPFETFMTQRRLALGPERVLAEALVAPDLKVGQDTIFNGVPHKLVEFRWGKIPVRIYLNRGSSSPSAVSTTSPLPFPWSIWGDVTVTTRWTSWSAQQFGVMTPGQFSTDINGLPANDTTVLSSKITFGTGSATLTPPIDPPKDDLKSLIARYKSVKVAEGITQYQGPFNTFVVDQPDGLVVIEPVLNSGFARAFLDLVAKDFPGKKVKAVVATDDAWPHFGGIRTFAARGAEMVVLDLNRPIVQRLCDAKYITAPDELANKPVKPRFRIVRLATSIGNGENQMVIYPIAGQGSERMMMIYFPKRRLLYGSDLLQKVPNGFFFPSYPKELAAAVARENLQVETVFAEHLGPTPWTTVTDFVKKIGEGNGT